MSSRARLRVRGPAARGSRAEIVVVRVVSRDVRGGFRARVGGARRDLAERRRARVLDVQPRGAGVVVDARGAGRDGGRGEFAGFRGDGARRSRRARARWARAGGFLEASWLTTRRSYPGETGRSGVAGLGWSALAEARTASIAWGSTGAADPEPC